MKANVQILRKRRYYSEDFKRKLVADYESGQYSISQLGRLHGIGVQLLYRWVHKYSTFNEQGSRIVEMKDSTSKRVKDLEQKVKELERIVGTKQIQIDYLEKMMDLAKERLDIDIKKNFGTPPSNGSENTGKK
jgi:transposase-like protein